MTWMYKDTEFDTSMLGEDGIGFVYCITDKSTGKKYIGKKLVRTIRKLPPLKGKKRKRRKVVDTDWKTYYGSSEEVKALVEELGEDNFHREILHICNSKGEMSYIEVKEIMLRDALISDEYYNGIIQCKIHHSHVRNLKGR